MPASLALSAPVSASGDFIGVPSAGLFGRGFSPDIAVALETDPAAGLSAVGGALQGLSCSDATSILEALSEQATALSLVLAADTAGAITLPDSLRALVKAAAVLPAFLGGAN